MIRLLADIWQARNLPCLDSLQFSEAIPDFVFRTMYQTLRVELSAQKNDHRSKSTQRNKQHTYV